MSKERKGRSKKEVATCCKQSVQMSQESMGERERRTEGGEYFSLSLENNLLLSLSLLSITCSNAVFTCL